jgi:hypothetical protein
MKARRAPVEVRDRFTAELAAAAAARRDGRTGDAWAALETAHVVSQPYVGMHTRSHWQMLTLAARTADVHEVLGQLARIALAAPGSASGRYPLGNTGRARESMFAEMPVSEELAHLVTGSS